MLIISDQHFKICQAAGSLCLSSLRQAQLPAWAAEFTEAPGNEARWGGIETWILLSLLEVTGYFTL